MLYILAEYPDFAHSNWILVVSTGGSVPVGEVEVIRYLSAIKNNRIGTRVERHRYLR